MRSPASAESGVAASVVTRQAHIWTCFCDCCASKAVKESMDKLLQISAWRQMSLKQNALFRIEFKLTAVKVCLRKIRIQNLQCRAAQIRSLTPLVAPSYWAVLGDTHAFHPAFPRNKDSSNSKTAKTVTRTCCFLQHRKL